MKSQQDWRSLSSLTAEGGTYSGGLQVISTYLQPGTEHPNQDYLSEFQGRVSAFHLGVEAFQSYAPRIQNQEVILDVGSRLFVIQGPQNGQIRADLRADVAEIKRLTEGHRHKIKAFYLIDEPTNWGISRTDLEQAIAELNLQMPGIPTYAVYAHDCFDNSSTRDEHCGLAGRRGIPSNLDIIGFDWFLGTNPKNDPVDFQNQIVKTVEKIKTMTGKPIVLVPDGTDQFLINLEPAWRDYHIERRLRLFYDYAKKESQIIALDNYAWANHNEDLAVWGKNVHIQGLRQWPASKKTFFELAAPFTPTTPIIEIPTPSCSMTATDGVLNGDGSVATPGRLSWNITNAKQVDYICTQGSFTESKSSHRPSIRPQKNSINLSPVRSHAF